MKRIASLALCATLCTVGLVGTAISPSAAEDATTSTTSSTEETAKQRAERMLAAYDAPDEMKAPLREFLAAMPDDADERMAAFREQVGLDHLSWQEIAADAIDPESYECAPTDLTTWARASMDDWGFFDTMWVIFTPILDMPTYHSLIFEQESESNVFGANGEYTEAMNERMADLRRFWDIPRDVDLVPLHGETVYQNQAQLAILLQLVWDVTPERSQSLAVQLMDVLQRDAYQGGRHPMFSLNAFAFDPTGDELLESLGATKRIAMGDGLMTAMEAIGIDPEVGPTSALAHEYGHHVQYAKHLLESGLPGPEDSRRTELMADSFGSYYMVHKLGSAINKERVLSNLKVSYNVGDCSFDSDTHHGTPNQRVAASQWAIDLAKAAPNQGLPSKLGGASFAEQFDAALPGLVAPDAG